MKLFECIGALSLGKTIARQFKGTIYKVSLFNFLLISIKIDINII